MIIVPMCRETIITTTEIRGIITKSRPNHNKNNQRGGFRGNGRGRVQKRNNQQRNQNNRMKWIAEKTKNTDQGNNKGENAQTKTVYTSVDKIKFIADSGATDHIVDNVLVLSNFKISENGVIKCANKIDFADIVIDGRGDLLLQSEMSNEETIELTNVIAAKEISENLLSLRKLAVAGFNIQLENKKLSL